MDSESNGDKETEANVKRLQDVLFPPHIANSGSYFSNFLIKTTQFAEDDDENRIKLKESLSFRELFVTNREANFTLQPARWPTECQVLEEKIEHINYIPPSLESYYPVTGNECQPKPSGEECGVIVYQYQPISAVNYFSRSNVGGSSYLLSSNLCPEEDGLKFESRFESGNLARAIRITPNYYELHLRADLYTNRHMQWFYFRVTNMKKGFLYRFSITNCSKENSLYNEGMRPLMYSKKDSQLHCIGWRRCGLNISYYCNDNVTPEDPDQQMTYTLTFTVEFPHEDDEVYLAHCYPYTYSDLQEFLQELSSHPVKSNYCNVRLLCKSLAGNNVYYVTITSPAIPGENKKKRAVVITARVHPGETPSSWMAKGILEFLSGDSSPAKELRDKFIFKIVPMLNPDGVIVGNNRCSLSAKDLNRQYRTVMRDTYPSIWYTKLMVRRLLEECGVAMYCDLHAHSRKHNIFIYGCENRRGCDKRLQEQVFPLMLHKNTAEKFSFESCKFRIQKAKEGTGRVVMWMMGIANSYTMEASFAGSTLGNRNDTHFNTQDYEQMGRSFCQTLLDFYDDDPRKEKLRNKIVDRLTKEGSNADEPTNIPLSDYSSDEGDTSSSSDEVGRDDEENEIIVPTPPPPSPVLVLKKPKPRSSPNRRVLSRSPCAPRKPLPVNRKYDLELRDYTQEEIDCPELNTDFKESSICWMKQSKPQHVVVASVQAPVKASAFSNIPSLIGECTSKCNEIQHTLPVFVSNPSQIFANVDSVLEAELNAIEEFKNAQLRNTSDLEQRKDKCDEHSLIEITTSTALPDYSVERSVYLAEFDSNHLKSELKALEKYKIKTDKRVEPKGMAKSYSDLFVLNNGLDLKKFKPSDLDIIDFKTEVQSLRSPRAEVLRSVSFLGQNEPELSSESTNISNSTSNSYSNPKIITLNSIGTQYALEGNNLNYVDETLQHVEVCDRSCGISETPVKKITRFVDDSSNSSKATYFSLICKHFLNNGQSVNIDNEPGKFDKGVNTKSSESKVISKNTQCNINNDNSDIHCTLLATLPRDRSPEICKATIKLSLSEKECLESSSDSDLNTDKLAKEKVKIFRKRRKKKKILKKKPQQPVQDYSDSEVQNMKKSQTQQGISVFDILPTEKLRSQLLTQCSKTPQPKVLSEKKNEITRQLAEVQAKLYTLKNKLWFGVGNGDAPLSWGSGRFYYSSNSRAASPQKFCKKSSKKNSKKQEKADKTVKKESKPKPDAKEKTTKNHNGLRRQAAVEWSVSVDNLKIRKSKSLPDNSAFNLALESKHSNDNDKRDKKNKKKKKPNSNNTGKFAKKVKAVTNAKSFTQKD